MENEKPKRGRKPKTPADDAAGGVTEANETETIAAESEPEPAEQMPIIGFTFYRDESGILYSPNDATELEAVTLPPVGRENEIGHWADVAYFSGYFPGITPAQFAIRLLVGDALGLRMANALFDLEIEPGGSIRWKPGQPAQAVGDAIAIKGGRQEPGGVVVDISTGRPADLRNGEVMEIVGEPNARSVPDFRPLGEAFQERPAAAFIVDLEKTNKQPPTISEVVARIKENPDATGFYRNEANKRPVSSTDPETPQGDAQTPAADPGPVSAAALAESTPTGDGSDDLGFPTGADPFASPAGSDSIGIRSEEFANAFSEPEEPETVDQEFDRVTAPDPRNVAGWDDKNHVRTPPPALQDPATPETASAAIAETLDGLEVGATVENWRTKIETWLQELEFSPQVVAGKMTTFAAANTIQKKSIFEQAETLYRSRISAKRFDVLTALAKDGKNSIPEMAGFFTYAAVNLDPELWTYTEAIKAFRVLEREFPNLLAPDPAPPAAA